MLNECASETEYGRNCYKILIGFIRTLDSTRPVTFASCKHFKDMCLYLVDMVSYNTYPRWYRKIATADLLNDCIEYINTHGVAIVDNGWAIKRPKTQNNKGVVDIYKCGRLSYEKVKELFK